MAISDHEPDDTKPAWGTWEDLLLGHAVQRFGTKWDLISSELQRLTSIHITPVDCQQNYTELKRRFNHSDDGTENDDDVVGLENRRHVAVPWLEQLRNARVTELQRGLQKCDLHISSLQLKVKKLKEEKEINGEKMMTSELGHNQNQNEIEQMLETKNQTVEPVASDSVSDRDNQSVNGSNGNLETGVEKSETEPEGSKPGSDEPGSGNVEPELGKGEPDGDVSEAPESIAESKSEGKNSDVQSSASKRKEEGERGLEPLTDEQSTDSVPVISLPLVDLLQRLHKVGSAVLEPRIDQQQKMRYKSLIREFVDYETLQTRLKQGWYSDGNDLFFRDLLLVVSNTRIFFPKESPESIAALDLRDLILKEMLSIKKQQLDTKPTDKQTSSKSSNLPTKRANEPADSLLLKPKLTGPIVVCRKRSSITAKAAGSSSGKKEQTDSKNSDKVTDETLKKSRDSCNLLAKKKEKSLVNETLETKPERKKKLTEAEEKKQTAAKFLNRMKRSNEPLLSSLKSSLDRGGSENDSKSDQKKSTGSKGSGGDGKKDQAGKKSSGGRQTKEQDSPTKRSVGRPPKRAAVLGKRNREPVVDSETLDSKQPKKRSKR
ncbi:uncharacterized protein LOC143594962 [Bidens hawaiensis]|uniref:uncharacterized protein LOC143594962 n=1 Tax=Bidens hawaiensis TaxID=980011 RepID=UPI0040496DCC